MHKNVGRAERRIRLALALILLFLVVMPVSPLSLEIRAILTPLAIAILYSGWRRFCPVYTLIGFDSRRRAA